MFANPLIYALALNLLIKTDAFSTTLECYAGFFFLWVFVVLGFFLFKARQLFQRQKLRTTLLNTFHFSVSTVGVNLPGLFKDQMGCQSGLEANVGYSPRVVCSSSDIL